ncbi:MAG TPA: ABC transporter ATP-binding protein [Ktedonobacterales bacterium]|jgi:putative ABC transport system ATP-binding protein
MDGARAAGRPETTDAARWQAGAHGQRAARGPALLEVRGLSKVFTSGGGQVVALREVNLSVYPGELAVIRGRSGAGKTTLLNLIAGLDDPTSGSVTLFGHHLGPLADRQRTELRRKDLGVVFQSAHLFPTLTARENVELPLRLVKAAPAERIRRTDEALTLVGLAARAQHRAPELSGGEQQRVALARALVHAPRLVLADEPTGNLDLQTGLAILELLRSISHQAGISFLMTTHDPAAVQMADELYDINDGVLTPASR